MTVCSYCRSPWLEPKYGALFCCDCDKQWAPPRFQASLKPTREKERTMSIAIDVDLVTEVLLTDGWHTVVDRSFFLDSYEYLWRDIDEERMVLLGGGTERLIPSTGFTFTEDTGRRISCPLTAILAVREVGA
jgi:hypothetical protein